MPASNETRVRVDDFSIQAILDGFAVERFARQFQGARAQSPGSLYPDLTVKTSRAESFQTLADFCSFSVKVNASEIIYLNIDLPVSYR